MKCSSKNLINILVVFSILYIICNFSVLFSFSVIISDSLRLYPWVCEFARAWVVYTCVPVSNILLLNGNESGPGVKPRPRLPAFSETGLTSQGLEHCLAQKVQIHTNWTHTQTHTYTYTQGSSERKYTKQNTKGTSLRVHFTWPFHWTKTDLRVRCLTKPREYSAWMAKSDKTKKGKRKGSLESMLTEERTAKFNRRVNWIDRGKDRQRRARDVSMPGLHITPPGKLREQRDICSTRLQGAFTLMSACHHIQDRRSRYTLRAESTHTRTHTHTHHIACTVSLPFPLSHSPPWQSTAKTNLYKETYSIAGLEGLLHYSHLIFTSKSINPSIREIFPSLCILLFSVFWHIEYLWVLDCCSARANDLKRCYIFWLFKSQTIKWKNNH